MPCDDPRNEVLTNLDGRLDNETDRIVLQADFDITDALTLRYTFGDARTRQLTTRDFDLSPRVASATDPFTASDAPVPLVDMEFDFPFHNDESSHELQLISNFDGPFNFVAGVFTYENATLFGTGVFGQGFQPPFASDDPDQAAQAAGFANCQDMLEVLEFDTDPTAAESWFCPRPGVDPIGNTLPGFRKFFTFLTAAKSETFAYFANAEYEINEQWHLSGGLRYTEDEKILEASIFEFILNVIDVPLGLRGSGERLDAFTWDQPIGHISVEYSPRDDALIYGRIATGYRAGTLNTEPEVALLKIIGEETLVNYELGVKGLFADDRLLLTAGVFFNDYDGYQYTGTFEPAPELLSITAESPYVESTANIPDTKIWGAEAEATFLSMTIGGYPGSTTISTRKSANSVRSSAGIPKGQPENGRTRNSQPWRWSPSPSRTSVMSLAISLPQQPHHKLSFTVAYTTPLEELGTLQLLSIYTFTGKRWPNLGNVPIQEVPSYSRWDLRANWTSTDKQWAVAGFVQNVLDKIGLQEYIPRSTFGGQPAMGGSPSHVSSGCRFAGGHSSKTHA